MSSTVCLGLLLAVQFSVTTAQGEWRPTYSEPASVHLTHPRVVILTHSSLHFDPFRETEPGINQSVAAVKAHGGAVIFLHDRYNPSNSPEGILCRDRTAGQLVASDVGNIDFNFRNVRHVCLCGGYFGQCERSTACDAIRLWRRDCPDEDFRLTQVVDGIFTVAEHVSPEDPYGSKILRHYFDTMKPRHARAAMSLDRLLRMIDDPAMEADYVCRQALDFPAGVHVQLDYFGTTRTLQSAGPNASTLTVEFRRSTDLLANDLRP